MEFDAFDAGVEPGGLRNKSEIKLLVCYLLKSIKAPIAKQHINEIMQEYGLANYFEVNQALSELSSTGSITVSSSGSDEIFSITQLGAKATETLESTLPISVREKVVNAAIHLLTMVRREKENRVDIQKSDDGYYVTCHISDSDSDLMAVKIYVADNLQAEMVRQQFLNDPAGIYNKIISLFSENSESTKGNNEK